MSPIFSYFLKEDGLAIVAPLDDMLGNIGERIAWLPEAWAISWD